MKPYLFLLLFVPAILAGQISLDDDFSDGDFTNNPTWTGDTGRFAVNTALRLQLVDSAAGNAYLSTASTLADSATWQFFLHLDFNPSGSNFAKVYVMSSRAELNQPLNGYFLRFSGSPDDRISLFRQSGTAEHLVLESSAGWLDTHPVNVRVELSRSPDGFWRLAADTAGGTNFTPLDSARDARQRWSSHFGLHYEYTKTRADKFFFDDLQATGYAYLDTTAPQLDSLKVLSHNQLELIFSESVEEGPAENPQNYLVNGGIGPPALAVRSFNRPQQVNLSFTDTFLNKTPYRLSLQNIRDFFGNHAPQNREFTYLRPQEGDVVINELMPDPSPSIGNPPHALPEREYIELYNRTAFTFNLEGWTLQAGSSSEVLPTFRLEPDTFVVIVREEYRTEFPPGLPLLGTGLSSVALVNSGATVALISPQGKNISRLSYSDDWYQDPAKEQGGWSLEQIDPGNLCGGAANWRASVDPNGGTPGRSNSVKGLNPDTAAPRISRISLPGDSLVMLDFSESLSGEILGNAAIYRFDPPLNTDSVSVPLSRDRVRLHLAEALAPETIYRLYLDSLPRDCSGNSLIPDTVQFGIPSVPDSGDILLNEVLFNPASGGSDFVEIYNASQKVIDLSRLVLANYQAASKALENPEFLREESYLFYPQTYLALSTDVAFIAENYPRSETENLVEVSGLPSLPDAGGSLAIGTKNLRVLDHFQFSEDWHLPVLEDPEGVSLERISHSRPAREKDNWHSAAATAGYATPGYKNSQYFAPGFSAGLQPQPRVFSPNQDGYRDQVKITYRFSQGNNVVNLSIYNAAGALIKEVAKNINTGPEGYFTWDGTNHQGQLVNRGTYIIVLDYFNARGARKILKETCVVSR